MPGPVRKVKFSVGVALFVTLGIAFISYLGLLWFRDSKSEQIVRQNILWQELARTVENVQTQWREGIRNDDYSSLIENCSLIGLDKEKQNNVDPSYYSCNSDFIQCWALNYNKHHKKLNIDFVKVSSPLTDGQSFGPTFKLYSKEYKNIFLYLHLEDSCSNVYLPERIYAHGSADKARSQNDWKFDIFNQAIYVDRFLVTNRDVEEWLKYDDKKFSASYKKGPLESRPFEALNLTPEMMKRFCAFRGKQIMRSSILDAASFAPGDLNNPRPLMVLRGPYPEGPRFSDSFLFEAMQNPKFEFKKEHCQKYFVKECRQKASPMAHSKAVMSWIGMAQVLGGPMEYVENRLHPKDNIRPSSDALSLSSPWHQIGRRIEWDEQGFNASNLTWPKKPDHDFQDETLKIAFRCQKIMPNKAQGQRIK